MPGGASQRAGGGSGGSSAPTALGARVSAVGSAGREGPGSTELAEGRRTQALLVPTQKPAQKLFSSCRSPSGSVSLWVYHEHDKTIGGGVGEMAAACSSPGIKAGPCRGHAPAGEEELGVEDPSCGTQLMGWEVDDAGACVGCGITSGGAEG